MTSRYARTTDVLINKTLRSLDAVEYIDGGTVIDATYNTEKRGIIMSWFKGSSLRDDGDTIHESTYTNLNNTG